MPVDGATQCPEVMQSVLRWMDQLPPGVALLIAVLAAVAAVSMWQNKQNGAVMDKISPVLQDLHSGLAVLLDRRGGN